MPRLKHYFKQIRRSPYQALSAILLTALTFFVISVFALVFLGAHKLLVYFESRPQVTAFFKDSADKTIADQLENKIKSAVPIDSAKYVSKEEALAIYKEQNKSDPLLLEMVTADILPASLEISTKNVADLETVATLMKNDPGVEEVVYQQDVVNTLKSWVRGVRIGGIILTAVLLLVSLATIVIILGLKFTAKKSEINTLSLLGATSWYIRLPFVFEGIFYTIVGAFSGWTITYIALLYLTPNLLEFFQGIDLLPVSPILMLILLGGELLLGAALGAFASLIATRRYGK